MRLIIIILSCLLPAVVVLAQKKDKKFSEGYVIRFNDTVRCRIYTGPQGYNSLSHEVKFRYNDGREMTYSPGSVIKGFGFKTDSTEKHYYVIPVPEYKINKEKNNKAYAEVLVAGHMKFLYYTYTEYNLGFTAPGSNAMIATKHTGYFLYKQNADSCISIGKKPLIGNIYFTKEDISSYLSDYPELLSEIKEDEKIHINELIEYVNRYNDWFSKNKQQ